MDGGGKPLPTGAPQRLELQQDRRINLSIGEVTAAYHGPDSTFILGSIIGID